ncbi:hypothetical protein [Amycolatopsis kentuckyensis]|uniref:hypothetical protein n=1 Tax=Amycolatopsis kentuckyensis TaxID=218823 RepID=UPI001177F319|nr:hypothetical protein [Amycolatopsis kentuckyensis]
MQKKTRVGTVMSQPSEGNNGHSSPVALIAPTAAVIAAIVMTFAPIAPATTTSGPAETVAVEEGGGGNTGNDVSQLS